MATVTIRPIPAGFLKFSRRVWPGHPPIFTDGEPTEADRELARELFAALDPDSQAWYAGAAWLAEPAKPRRKQHGS